MLTKLPLNRLKDKKSEMISIADRMEKLNYDRLQKLVEINKDTEHTLAWKTTMAEPLTQSPELVALSSQIKLLVAVVEEQKGLWRDSATLLRDSAVPRRDQMGVDAYTTSLAELNFLLNEANALSQSDGALQVALDRAVLAEDWRSVYALTVGRIDKWGRALSSDTGLAGTPLNALPLPGRDESEEIFYQCDVQKIRAEGVMLCLSNRDMNPTADSSRTKLVRNSALLRAQKAYENMVQQRDRVRSKMTALERWELLKDGAPVEPTFDAQVKSAVARAKVSNLDDSEAQIPKG
jgi:hypothetical protein